jgi:hypothetical protein
MAQTSEFEVIHNGWIDLTLASYGIGQRGASLRRVVIVTFGTISLISLWSAPTIIPN